MQFIKAFSLTLLITIGTITAWPQKQYASLNHVAIYVYNLQKSTVFYKDIMALEPIAEPFHDGKHSWFKVGAHAQLHVIEGAHTIMPHDKNSHLCFSVPSMPTFISRLTKAGIAYEDWPGKANSITTRPDGVQQIYFKDPDGYWIEVNNDQY